MLVAAFAVMQRGPWLAPFAVAIGVWVAAGAVSEWALRIKLFSASREEAWRRARNLPRSAHGTTLAHFGVGMMLIGIVATSAWQSENIVAMKPGDRTSIAGYDLEFRGLAPAQGPNYIEQVGVFAVTRGGAPVTELAPSKRLYDMPRRHPRAPDKTM